MDLTRKEIMVLILSAVFLAAHAYPPGRPLKKALWDSVVLWAQFFSLSISE